VFILRLVSNQNIFLEIFLGDPFDKLSSLWTSKTAITLMAKYLEFLQNLFRDELRIQIRKKLVQHICKKKIEFVGGLRKMINWKIFKKIKFILS